MVYNIIENGYCMFFYLEVWIVFIYIDEDFVNIDNVILFYKGIL